jgi:hypothetical protein
MSIIPVTVSAHIEFQGDVLVSGPQQFVGNKGIGRKVEGFTIYQPPVAGVEIEYMAHLEGTGDTYWYKNGQFVGTKGQSKRLEGFAVRLVGPNAGYYTVKYYAHLGGYGDSPIAANGEFTGTRGQSRSVEGLAVWLEPRAVGAPIIAPIAAPVAYTPTPVYPQSTPVYPQPAAVYPNNYTPAPAYTPSVVYSPAAPTYTPTPAYTPTYTPTPAYTPTYTPTPAYTPTIVFQPPTIITPTISIVSPGCVAGPQTHVIVNPQGSAPISAYGNAFAGTKGQHRALEGFSIGVAQPGLHVEYMAHIADRGDSQWHRDGQHVGRGSSRIEGFAVRLSGPASRRYNVKYYAHVADIGDTAVGANGSYVGTKGQRKQVEGMAVWIEPK